MLTRVALACALAVLTTPAARSEVRRDLAALGERLGVDLVSAEKGWQYLRSTDEVLEGEVEFLVESTKQNKTLKTVLTFSVVPDGSVGKLIERQANMGHSSATCVVSTGEKSYLLRQENDKSKWTLLFAQDAPKFAADTISIKLSFLKGLSAFLSEPAEKFLLRDGFSALRAQEVTFAGVPGVRIDLKWKGLHPVGNRPCDVSGFFVMVPEWNWMIVRVQKTIRMDGQDPVCIDYQLTCDPTSPTKDIRMVKEIRSRWISGEDATSRMNEGMQPDIRQIRTFHRLKKIPRQNVDTSLKEFGIPDLDYTISQDEVRRDSETAEVKQSDSPGEYIVPARLSRLRIAAGVTAGATVLAIAVAYFSRRKKTVAVPK